MSAKDGLMILERWFGFKNVKITEAAPASQEATHKFPNAIKNISEEKNYLPEQVFHVNQSTPLWKEKKMCQRGHLLVKEEK